MKTFAQRWSLLADPAGKPERRRAPQPGACIERLEARIAPATLAALPGNSNFEDPTDFANWTVNTGPGSVFVEYAEANVTTSVVRGSNAPEGDAYALLSFTGRVAPADTGFGPSLQSETFIATPGEEISVIWRATNNGDIAHPRARLFTGDGTPVATFFDADTGTTAYATSSVTVPSAGEYYLLFEVGSSDVSVGGVIGATLEIDAIHRTPSGVAVSTLGNGQLSIEVSGGSPASGDSNAFLVSLDETGEFLQIFVNGSLDFIQPLSSIDSVSIVGSSGDDTLTVDSSNGLIVLANGMSYDGGGGTDTLNLVQVGGVAHTSEVYSFGAASGQGSATINGTAGTQSIAFLNTEPVRSNVPVANLTITGTADGNTFALAVGAGGGIFTGSTGAITSDAGFSLEFNKKAALTLDGAEGADTFSLGHPTAAEGLTAITVIGGEQAGSSGDRLEYLGSGAINPFGSGIGTITSVGQPTVAFSGMEIASVAGFGVAPEVAGAIVTAVGDVVLSGQHDVFIVTLNGDTGFLSLAVNGSIGLFAARSSILRIDVDGKGGSDSLTFVGTAAAETFTFAPTAVDAGAVEISGALAATYTSVDVIALNGQGGDDTFVIGGEVGVVHVIGGFGSDRLDFSNSPSRVVVNLDTTGVDQFINATGQILRLGDPIENFTGSAFNDTLRARAANFPRDFDGGDTSQEVRPPGDELFFDGQQKVVTTALSNYTTGVYTTVGYADVTFSGFDSPTIVNSPSGPGFGLPGDNKAFDNAHIYDLLKATTNGKRAPGKTPTAVATGDFNGDGFADMVVVNSGTARIAVLLNLGDGTFADPVAYRTKGLAPRDIVIGNFDATPGLDLAVTNRTSNTLSIFSGDGSGGFSVPTLIKTAATPTSIAVGRLNADGIDDLVIVHSLQHRVSVLLGNGDGFERRVLVKTGGTRPLDVVIADFDADGVSDIATVNFASKNVSFLKGDGSGAFAVPTLFVVGTRPNSIAVSDFNLDGVPDLAVTNRGSSFLSVLFSNGATGGGDQFAPQLQIPLSNARVPRAIAAADFNGDGIADIGVLNKLGTEFTILLGAQLGVFSQPYQFDLGEFRSNDRKTNLTVADLNNDGLLDVINLGRNSNDVRVLLRKI